MTQSTYSRARPSARYVELIKQYELMHRRGAAAHDARSKKTFDGIYMLRHVARVKELIDLNDARTLLDYGCGKGRQYTDVNWQLPDGKVVPPVSSYWGCTAITCYDPAFPPFARLPTGTFDAVICTDVLEHCPQDDLPWIMDELFHFAEKFVFANVACYAARKRLPNGENAHCTVKPVGWWRDLIRQTSQRRPHVRFYFELESSRRGWEGQMIPSEVACEGFSQKERPSAVPAARTSRSQLQSSKSLLDRLTQKRMLTKRLAAGKGKAMLRIFIGWDSRFPEPADVLLYSLKKHASIPIDVHYLNLAELTKQHGFQREHDPLASTEFTYTRFLVPGLCDYAGKAIFMDNDMLCLGDVKELDDLDMAGLALRVVKHDYQPTNTVKMYGCPQTSYPRKNWSSLMMMDCSKLTLWTKEVVATQTGAYLHRFEDIADDAIGEIPKTWNTLDWMDSTTKLIHYTNGGPWYEQYEDHPHADVWFRYRDEMRAAQSRTQSDDHVHADSPLAGPHGGSKSAKPSKRKKEVKG